VTAATRQIRRGSPIPANPRTRERRTRAGRSAEREVEVGGPLERRPAQLHGRIRWLLALARWGALEVLGGLPVAKDPALGLAQQADDAVRASR